jgi:polyisoprenoid-binding protein YceI
MDPNHTDIIFAVRRNGIVDVHGRFDKASGTMQFDNARPENSSVTVTIETPSLSMLVPQLEAEMKEPGAFDVTTFPQASFVSTKVTRTGPTTGAMTGDMTIKGVVKPVTFQITFNGTAENLIGFHATTTIRRTDFNIGAPASRKSDVPFDQEVANDVLITVDTQFMKPRNAPPPPAGDK